MYRSEVLDIILSLHKFTNVLQKRMIGAHNLIQVRSLRFQLNKRVSNPGVEKRLEELGFTDKDSITYEELDEIENSESDFMNINVTHRETEREMKKMQDYVRSKIVEKKYFKQKQEPALLTWEEKEQIRHLYKLNPEKWNVHLLAASFPATESVIKKILNAKWRHISIDRISAYNKSVEKNWKMLYEGELDISSETRAHLARFSSRKNVILPSTESYSVETTESNIVPVSREFSNIVQPPKSQKLITDPFQKIKESFAQDSRQNAPEDETYVLEESEKKRPQTSITLEMYREKILRSGKPLDPIDKALVDSYKVSLVKQEDSKDPVSSNNFSVAQYNHTLQVKRQQNRIHGYITIPPHLKRKGTLFKLDDCYYDEDGELLYRVPGMS